ncbi:hypothetical protein AMR41_19650 [Hapalosiphon sp. MRB220]|nr:hypothetical protein AMR41_19650 [Hapalosiphon sp. MRB220]
MTEIINIESISAPQTMINISLSRQISAPREKVWEAISKPGNLSYCHPFCEKNSVEKWPGIGSEDTVYFYSGKVATRYFTKWIEGVGYDLNLSIQSINVQVNVIFRISSIEENYESLLNISIIINILPTTLETSRSGYLHFIRRSLENYLDSVLKGYEYYITTGQAVKRNQFGSHPIFSPAIDIID